MDDEDKSVFWYYEICPFRTYQRSFRLFHGNFSKDIHPRSRLLCFTCLAVDALVLVEGETRGRRAGERQNQNGLREPGHW